MMRSESLELLAPAGNLNTLKAVINAGADAVYFGGSLFGARAYAGNLNREEILEAIDFGHIHGRKLMLAVNTLLKEKEIKEQLYEYLLPYYDQGLDAVIVQDFGVMHFIRSRFPGLAIHASTQMTVTGAEGAKFLAKNGASRVVLARELSLSEIKKIHQETPVELECFVHGALCYSYSGQCLFSSLLGGRSGNRGRCAQPCRLSYEVYGADFHKLNDKRHSYPLSPKDLCTIELLPKLAASGVYSFKIEGRMKQTEYAAGVVSVYRSYIDRYLNYGEKDYIVSEKDKKILLDLGSRCGFTRGYYEQKNGPDMITFSQSSHENKNGSAPDLPKEQKEKIKGRIRVKKDQPAELTVSFGDTTAVAAGETPMPAENRPLTEEILKSGLNKTGNTPFVFEELSVELEEGLFLSAASVNELRRQALDRLKKAYLQKFRRKKFCDSVRTGEEVFPENLMRTKKGSFPENLMRTKEEVFPENLMRTKEGGFPENPMKTEKEFPPKSLNKSDQRKEKSPEKTVLCGYPYLCQKMYGNRKIERAFLSASAEREEQIPPLLDSPAVSRIYIDSSAFPRKDILRKLETLFGQAQKRKKQLYFILPAVFRNHTAAFYQSVLHDMKVDGFLAKSYDALAFLLERDIKPGKIRLDHNLYSFSEESRYAFYGLGIEGDTLPFELNRKEMKNRNNYHSEMVVYGYQPLMISAQCVRKNLTGCDHMPEICYLKDRYGIYFPVKNHCNECYNVIYNSRPLQLLSALEELKDFGIAYFRLSFTLESGGQTEEILTLYERQPVFEIKESAAEETKAHTKKKIYVEAPNIEYTYGHFKRGVE